MLVDQARRKREGKVAPSPSTTETPRPRGSRKYLEVVERARARQREALLLEKQERAERDRERKLKEKMAAEKKKADEEKRSAKAQAASSPKPDATAPAMEERPKSVTDFVKAAQHRVLDPSLLRPPPVKPQAAPAPAPEPTKKETSLLPVKREGNRFWALKASEEKAQPPPVLPTLPPLPKQDPQHQLLTESIERLKANVSHDRHARRPSLPVLYKTAEAAPEAGGGTREEEEEQEEERAALKVVGAVQTASVGQAEAGPSIEAEEDIVGKAALPDFLGGSQSLGDHREATPIGETVRECGGDEPPAADFASGGGRALQEEPREAATTEEAEGRGSSAMAPASTRDLHPPVLPLTPPTPQPPPPALSARPDTKRDASLWEAITKVLEGTRGAMAPSAEATVIVRFSVIFVTRVGQNLRLVGDHPALGSWQHRGKVSGRMNPDPQTAKSTDSLSPLSFYDVPSNERK